MNTLFPPMCTSYIPTQSHPQPHTGIWDTDTHQMHRQADTQTHTHRHTHTQTHTHKHTHTQWWCKWCICTNQLMSHNLASDEWHIWSWMQLLRVWWECGRGWLLWADCFSLFLLMACSKDDIFSFLNSASHAISLCEVSSWRHLFHTLKHRLSWCLL